MADKTHQSAQATTPGEGLHICESCRSDLVYPQSWEASGRDRWSIVLRCPECEWRAEGVFDQREIDVFDEQLDLGTEALLRNLKLMVQANLEDEIDRFVGALEAGAILPEDF